MYNVCKSCVCMQDFVCHMESYESQVIRSRDANGLHHLKHNAVKEGRGYIKLRMR